MQKVIFTKCKRRDKFQFLKLRNRNLWNCLIYFCRRYDDIIYSNDLVLNGVLVYLQGRFLYVDEY